MSRISTVITGMRFGRWTVVDAHLNWMALCVCNCGTEKSVKHHSLLAGKSKSCGCLQREQQAEAHRHRRHAMPEYQAWCNMKSRCYNPNLPQYKDWGGRGIKICERWKDFSAFLSDMGARPQGTSLDRKDTNGDYTPDNCQWSTRRAQNLNKRSNVILTANGIAMTQSQWAETLNTPSVTILSRIKRGWSDEEAITTPTAPQGEHDNDGRFLSFRKGLR